MAWLEAGQGQKQTNQVGSYSYPGAGELEEGGSRGGSEE